MSTASSASIFGNARIEVSLLALDPLDQDGCQKQNRTGDKVGGKSHDLEILGLFGRR